MIDRYLVDFGDGRPIGPSDPELTITAKLHGGDPPRDAAEIGWRIGIDLAPVDATDPGAARWLLACVWPDDLLRFERLRSALALAARTPPPVRLADAVDGLAAVFGEVPDVCHPVVVNSWVLTYLEPEHRRRFVELLDELGRRRDLTWVFQEQRDMARGLPFAESLPHREAITELTLVDYRVGARTVHRLAEVHPHGRWIEWQAD